jgi:putative zinc finger/helix-turn-helix YgiT family protein
MNTTCQFCDFAGVKEVSYDDVMSAGRKRVSLSGLVKTVCPECGEEYVTEAQIAHNHALFESALARTPEAIVVGQLRALRDRWHLSQRAASALFGAGESAFGKWESGQEPSAPAALLLQCASNVSGVMEYLAHLQGATLPGCPELAEWHAADGSVTGVAPTYRPRKNAAHAPAPATNPPLRRLRYERDILELKVA